MDEKTKFYEKIKEEQTLLRKRMNNLNDFLKKEKQDILKKKNIGNTLVNKNFTTYKKNGLCFVRSSHVRNTHILCDYCCHYGRMKRECYVKRNINFEMKALWVLKNTTNPHGPKSIWYEK